MKLTVKNISTGPVGVHTSTGYQQIARGAEITADFSDAEAANMATNSLIDIGEKAKAGNKGDGQKS